MSTTNVLHPMMADNQGNDTSRVSKGTTRLRHAVNKRTKYSKSTCPITRSSCSNTEVPSKKMPRISSRLYSKPSSIILRIKQHPLSLEVHLPEQSRASPSATDSSDSDNSHGGASRSSSTVNKKTLDDDSDAESSYTADGEVSCVIDSFSEQENKSAFENRSILIHRMAEVALHIKLGPTGLYLAVQLLDLYWNHHREKGKLLDSVQLQVLAVTCVYVANNCFCSSKSAPDDFCLRAGVAEGTVKGCMIERQEASLITLLGGPQVAATISTWGLWRKMGHPSNQQHLLQFVNLLKSSDFGKAHFPRDLMQASHFSSNASTATVEILSKNAAAKVVNSIFSSARSCAPT